MPQRLAAEPLLIELCASVLQTHIQVQAPQIRFESLALLSPCKKIRILVKNGFVIKVNHAAPLFDAHAMDGCSAFCEVDFCIGGQRANAQCAGAQFATP